MKTISSILAILTGVVSTPPAIATVVAYHESITQTNLVWGYDWFILGQSFKIDATEPVRVDSFSWLGVSGMPQTDTLYVLDSQYDGLIQNLSNDTSGFIASAQLIEGTSTYEFSGGPLLTPGRQYFAYMTTSLQIDRYIGGRPVCGPAETAMPNSFTGYNPSWPLNWFDSYPQGKAYGYVWQQFTSLSDSITEFPRYERDFQFEVTGTVVPESSCLLISLIGFFAMLGRRRRHGGPLGLSCSDGKL